MLFSKTFYASNTKYIFELTKDYTIDFYAVSGFGRNGKKIAGIDHFGSQVPGTALTNLSTNPIAVLRSVLGFLKSAIAENAPPYFQFSAAETKRKKLYRKLIPKIESSTGYKYVSGTEFLFVRKS